MTALVDWDQGEHRHDNEYTFSIHDASRSDGRRCLSVIELKALAWNKDVQGRWRTPAKVVSEDGGTRSERRRDAA